MMLAGAENDCRLRGAQGGTSSKLSSDFLDFNMYPSLGDSLRIDDGLTSLWTSHSRLAAQTRTKQMLSNQATYNKKFFESLESTPWSKSHCEPEMSKG